MEETTSLLLFSGGFDSVVLLNDLVSSGNRPELFFIDYGQRNSNWEFNHTVYWGKKFDLQIYRLQIPPILWTQSKLFGDGLSDYDKTAETSHYIEMRNLIFISYALSYAESKKYFDVYLALISGTYADSTPSFIKAMDSLAYSAIDMEVSSPYVHLSKYQLVDIVKDLDASLEEILEHSISCNLVNHDGIPCGECLDCEAITLIAK